MLLLSKTLSVEIIYHPYFPYHILVLPRLNILMARVHHKCRPVKKECHHESNRLWIHYYPLKE